ncbi:hypothetical protein LQZ21_07760 [Treponema sp. TIM-1]|uniref:hypothetical protein n=1 Tax=Treponema sp. TIM-1 TaxID=2898417 RepID=UPI0039812099
MNKKLVYGMIALLSVSFLILGCSTGTSNDSSTVNPPSPTPPGTTGASGTSAPTKAELAANAASALEDGTRTGTVTVTPNPADGSVTIGGSGTLTIDSLKIDSGVKIVVASTATLVVEGDITNDGTIEVAGTYTLEAGATVTNNGTITVNNADFTVEGTIANSGTIEVTGSTGTYTLEADATVTNTGTIVIGSDAGFTAAADGTINNAGTITVEGDYTLPAGTKGTNNGTVIIGPDATATIGADVRFGGSGIVIVEGGGKVYFDGASDPFIGRATDSGMIFVVPTDSKFHFNNTSFIVEGSVTLKSAFNNVGDQVFLIKENSTLTLEAALSLTGNFTDDDGNFVSFGVVGELGTDIPSAATITIGTGGSIVVASATSNFYNGSGVITNSISSTATFKWVADADNVSTTVTPGWKQQ